MPSILSPRRMIEVGVLLLCLILIVHIYGVEAFVVPTGSMAPALVGHHRAAACPVCGFRVLAGRQMADAEGVSCYAAASCPNCGSAIDLEKTAEATGDHILVNKGVYAFRRPRRWEIVVFRLFGKVFVKRVIGLPGEWIMVEDGDVYIDGELARKTLAEFKEIRVLLLDEAFQPLGYGEEGRGGECVVSRSERIGAFLWKTYENLCLPESKASPILDEYAYNAGNPRAADPVHDFMMECDIAIKKRPVAAGKIALAITDGQDSLVVEIPVGTEGMVRVIKAGTLPPTAWDGLPLAEGRGGLTTGKTHRLEMAFVDRRLTLQVDGREFFPALDLPPARSRAKVSAPVSLGVLGTAATFRNIRLYRDLHYTQAGRNAVHGRAVHLCADQYFVMGDNSPNSEDSRFWPDHGTVPAASLIGKPFLVHMPSRVLSGRYFGRSWQVEVPDWSRLRWLR